MNLISATEVKISPPPIKQASLLHMLVAGFQTKLGFEYVPGIFGHMIITAYFKTGHFKYVSDSFKVKDRFFAHSGDCTIIAKWRPGASFASCIPYVIK